MAGRCSKLDMVVAAATVILVLMLAVVNDVGARPVKQRLKATGCNTTDEYVYPYWSRCWRPAALSEEYHYVSIAAGLGAVGGLEPEWDETNATYYVRLTGNFTDVGATYVAVAAIPAALLSKGPHNVKDSQPLLVNSTVYILNAESGRALQWREEGTDESFLIEEEASTAAPFRFLQAAGIPLACPLPYPPVECQAYFLVSDDTASGLLSYPEEGAIYLKAAAAGSLGDVPILVVRPTDTTSFI